ncbi:MAG: hypothetical protein WBM61_09140 [Woeseiaceae bacterium]
MNSTKKFNGCALILMACLMLAACAARPQLVAKTATAPVGVDLSGRWQLRIEPESTPMSPNGAEPGIRIPPAGSTRNPGRRPSRGKAGAAVRVFVENGESLKISQTDSGLFISFDRSVVEEYTFGENRVVSVGPIEAQRVSGWQNGSFVIQTLDEEGAILTESWRLVENGKVLVREISQTQGNKETFAALQRFDKV